MFFGKHNTRIRRNKFMHPIVFLPVFITILIVINACRATKGSIMILEEANGSGFTMDFREWSSKDKCRLSLKKGDELRIEVIREDGQIGLTITGENGSEPYVGNDLDSFAFNVTVPGTDTYVIRIAGKNATGKVIVKNLNS